MDLESLTHHFQGLPTSHDHCSLRFVRKCYQSMEVRRNILQPIGNESDSGYMLSVYKNGGYGYAATCDLRPSSLRQSYEIALKRAEYTADKSIFDYSKLAAASTQGSYKTSKYKLWGDISFSDKVDLLTMLNEKLKTDPKIVEWSASLLDINETHLFINSSGAAYEQEFQFFIPNLEVYANDGSDTVHRSLKGRGFAKQGGIEIIENMNLAKICEEISSDVKWTPLSRPKIALYK
ncbi:MAG: hypothetical protein HRU09_08655 [Oligoflexales bacterium]|nr:hypothetical protein [Oligoflexales bacterium]